jgi:predicted small metal-binding protein
MKIISCREAKCECDYVAKGETEEEVMRDAVRHGIEEHGNREENMTKMKEMLRSLIHDSGSTATATSSSSSSLRQPTEPG